tara:strand:+ start:699 stop:1709 length:1011 start_codon:yes stop_codon:yes gene_type:complete
MEFIFGLILIAFAFMLFSNALTKRDIRKLEDETIKIIEESEKIASGEITSTRSLYGDQEADFEESLPSFIKKCEEYASEGNPKIFSVINKRIDDFSNLPRIKEMKDDDYEKKGIRDAKAKLMEAVINGKFVEGTLFWILSPCWNFHEIHGGGYDNQKIFEEKIKATTFDIDQGVMKDLKKEINEYVEDRKNYTPDYFPTLGIDSLLIIYLYPHMHKFLKNDWFYEDLDHLDKLIERFDIIFDKNKKAIKENFESARVKQTKKNIKSYEKAKAKDKFTAAEAQKYLDLATIFLFDENKSTEEVKELLDEIINKAIETKITKSMKEKIDTAKQYKANL